MDGGTVRILGFGTYNTSAHPRVGILLDGLRDAGHTVTELNEPLTVSTESRVAALSSPSAALTFFGALVTRWTRLIRGRAAYRGKNRPDAVLVGYLGHFDVLLARLLFPQTTIILDHLIYAADTAADRGARGGLLRRLLTVLDRLALTAADIVASHSIGLGIFGTTEKAQRVVPNKVYQSMAAGCATITSDTAPQRDVLGDAATYAPAGDAEALASAIRELVGDDERREEMRERAFRLASRAFSHGAVIAPLEERLTAERPT